MISTVTFTPATTNTAITLHSNSNRNLTRVEGLIGPTQPRMVQKVAPGRDGILDDTRYLSERVITLEGELWNSSGGAAVADLGTISEAFASTMYAVGKLTVTYENSTVRWCNVKLSGPVQTSFEGANKLVQYQVQFVATDPRLYSTTLNTSTATLTGTSAATSSTVTVSNGGTAPSNPVFTFTQPSGTGRIFEKLTVNVPTNYATVNPYGSAMIVQTGSSLEMEALGTTATATIDTATRSISGNIDNVSSVTEFPILFPGSSTWNWSMSASAGATNTTTCTMSWYDAYWG